jgi:glycosyltransferase involved in cell wall biosynthesis
MKICLVTAFPPSRGGLSEYGFHLARELQKNPLLDLTILADELPLGQAELEGFSVLRCWSFDHPKSLSRLWNSIRRLDPDVVWFNLLFSTFGHKPLAAFCGLTLPLLARLSGFYTHVTLHHLMEAIDLKDAGVRFPRLYRSAGALATRILLKSNSVSVLVPAYRQLLVDKYGSRNVHVRSHGILSQYPEHPDFSRRGNPFQRILAFGKWGTYKRLEPILEAFKVVARCLPNARLVIAGGDHPSTPGYVASMAKRFESESRIEFTGYVPEAGISGLFHSASIAVMAYSSATGSSGVAHIACTFGVPIISANLVDFCEMADEEGMAMEFYEAGNSLDLANRLIALLRSPKKQLEMAEQNFSAALRMTMPQIVYRYLRQFDLDQKTKALRTIARLRKLPGWFPLRAFGNISAAWKVAVLKSWSSLVHSVPSGGESASLNGNGLRPASLNGSGVSSNHHRRGTGSDLDRLNLGWRQIYGSGIEPDSHHSNGTAHENPIHVLPIALISHEHSRSTNATKPNGKHHSPLPSALMVKGTGNGHDRHSDGSVSSTRAGAQGRQDPSLTRGETLAGQKAGVVGGSELLMRNNDIDAA